MDNSEQKQLENFELGTICNFTALAFLTLLPFLTNSYNLHVDASAYKFFAVFFLVLTGFFYNNSADYSDRQIIIIGSDFICFTLFQFYLAYVSSSQYSVINIMGFLLGLSLILFEFFINKR